MYAQQLRFHLAQHMLAQTHYSHCLFEKHAPSSTNYKSPRTTTPASASSSTNYKSRRTTTHASASSSTNYKSRRKTILQVVRITSPDAQNSSSSAKQVWPTIRIHFRGNDTGQTGCEKHIQSESKIAHEKYTLGHIRSHEVKVASGRIRSSIHGVCLQYGSHCFCAHRIGSTQHFWNRT